jgi:DNA-binding IclR family transcriptional regulator
MPRIPAARNTLGVLRYLAAHSKPVGASALARDLRIPRSSVYQLVRVMMDEGFVVHYPEDRAYGLSSLVVEIGSASLQTERLGRLAMPLMERLVAQAGIPVVAHLAVLTAAEVTYVAKVQGARAPTTVSSVGVRLPAHLTATGRAMLARLPPAQVRALYPHRESLVRRLGQGPSTLAELDHLLAAVGERGWAVELGDIAADYGSVGAAALDHKGYPVAGIGLTYRLPGSVAGLGEAVVATAEALTARLAGRA